MGDSIVREKLFGAKLNEDNNVELVRGEVAATNLPAASVDLVLLANVWHELDDPGAAVHEIIRILKPDGRVAVLDWRTDVAQPPGPPLAHRIEASAVAADLRDRGLIPAEPELIGSYSYLLLARRP